MLKRVSLLLLLCCFIKAGLWAQGSNQEASLKAVFIYNFTKYIEWDNLGSDDNFIIGIMGTSALDATIEAIAKKNFVKNKKIILRHFNSPEDIGYCHMLFIPGDYPAPVRAIAERVNKKVLIITEKQGAAKQGAAINFILLNDKLKFEINTEAVYTAGLKASSQLLKLAIIVD
jgi:hypothetical protein